MSLAIVVLLTGCNKLKDEPVKEHKPKEIESVQKGKVEFPNHFPLTGMGTKQDISDRAVAVMVNNDPKARPQEGLDKADIVYEILAEGSITRFLAIFQSEKPEKIGPVRSSRAYYINLAKGYDSLYIAHGYSPEAKEMLSNGYIDNLNGMYYDGTLFKRSSKRVAPHNSYITFDNILKGADQKGYSMKGSPEPLVFLSEDEQKQLKGTAAGTVTVSYYNNNFTVTYEYDADLGKYKRYTSGVQTVSEESGKPVLLENVFIVETQHQTVDSSGRRNININSGGKAYLLQKGLIRSVEWINENNRILPVLNGSKVGFVQGKTWINFVPTNPGLTSFVKFDSN